MRHLRREESRELDPQEQAELLLQKEREARHGLINSLTANINGLDHIFNHIPFSLSNMRMTPWCHRLEEALRELEGDFVLLSGESLKRAITISDDVAALLSSMPNPHDESAYDKRILTPFMDRCRELTPVVNELVRELQVKKEENIEARGKELRELPMKSLEESKLLNSKRAALAAAQAHLSATEAKALEAVARRSVGEESGEGEISLEESRLRRYLGNIEEAQKLKASLAPGVTSINGVPVDEMVEGIISGNTEKLRSEVVAPGERSPEDSLLALSYYTESLGVGCRGKEVSFKG